jgi:hypothetical protein
LEKTEKISTGFTAEKKQVPGAFSAERIRISEAIMLDLVQIMNHIHEVNYPYRFWKIVLSDYVNALISIKPFLEKTELNTAAPLQPVNSHHLPGFKQRLIARLPALIKHFKSPGSKLKVFKQLRQHSNISIGFPDLDVVKADTGERLTLYYPVFPGWGNTAKRKRADGLAIEYTDTFKRNMIKQLPKIYVEYFDRLFNEIPLYEPEKKVFHAHGLPPFYNALVIAKHIINGSKLYSYQHGAFYGEMTGHNSHHNETSVCDEFRTWGWKIKPNDVPWKAYRLEKFKREYDAADKTGEFDFLMCYPDVYDANIGFYKDVTAYFLTHIDPEKYKKLLARPRPLNRLFSHAGKISFIKDSRVTIDSGLSAMPAIIGKSRVVIQFNIPATNFFECLYVNHPTIGLLDNDQPTDIVKPYYEFLKEQGVIHHNFASLVQHLNNVNIDTWWMSVTEQPMYLKFKNEFLRKVW